GGTRALLGVYLAVAALLFAAGLEPGGAGGALLLFMLAMLCLGAGNGAVFQLVPQRFGGEIGAVTGLIGMAGGVGGFLLAAGLGVIKQASGGYAIGLWLYAALALTAWAGLAGLRQRWRAGWTLASTRV
ncbi:MFS transporter, partial [Chromobacterium aquaticum]|nr:MFS transporter [Chromobacterium aquaticum]